MKLITPAMKAHIESDVTTLATCWKITRQDGEKFFYTEHDRNITYGGDVYKSTGGFNKSAISSNATLGVDEMEVSGFLQDNGINDEELRNGAFDFAQVEVFAVNYMDLSNTMGIIKLRAGWFGEVRTSDTGAFLVELRGLVDMLGSKIGRTYLQECDADLGDDRCGIALYARRHQAGRRYEEGNRVRYPIAMPFDFNDRHYPETLDPNEPNYPWHYTNLKEADLNVNPVVGPKFLMFAGEQSGNGGGRQVNIPLTKLDVTNIEKNAGLYQITITGKYYSYFAGSVPSMAIKMMSDPLQIDVVEYDGGYVHPSRFWRDFRLSVPLHPSAMQVGVFLGTAGSEDEKQAAVCFDDLDLFIEPIAGENRDYRHYGNREFICINPGKTAKNTPTFNTTLGSTTSDGGVVWEAHRPKYVILADVVEDATDSTKIKIDTAAPGTGKSDDFFRWGVLHFLTGPNRGRSVEMLNYNEDTGVIHLALPVPYRSMSGDIVVMQVGCDKRASTCMSNKFDNIINYRGFPRMPGEGQYFKIAGHVA